MKKKKMVRRGYIPLQILMEIGNGETIPTIDIVHVTSTENKYTYSRIDMNLFSFPI